MTVRDRTQSSEHLTGESYTIPKSIPVQLEPESISRAIDELISEYDNYTTSFPSVGVAIKNSRQSIRPYASEVDLVETPIDGVGTTDFSIEICGEMLKVQSSCHSVMQRTHFYDVHVNGWRCTLIRHDAEKTRYNLRIVPECEL